jgi:hypothetical protein
VKTKLAQLKEAASAGNWQGAVLIAAKFADLGGEKAPILKAREAYLRPGFQRQLGKNPDELITAGIEALRRRYNV